MSDEDRKRAEALLRRIGKHPWPSYVEEILAAFAEVRDEETERCAAAIRAAGASAGPAEAESQGAPTASAIRAEGTPLPEPLREELTVPVGETYPEWKLRTGAAGPLAAAPSAQPPLAEPSPPTPQASETPAAEALRDARACILDLATLAPHRWGYETIIAGLDLAIDKIAKLEQERETAVREYEKAMILLGKENDAKRTAQATIAGLREERKRADMEWASTVASVTVALGKLRDDAQASETPSAEVAALRRELAEAKAAWGENLARAEQAEATIEALRRELAEKKFEHRPDQVLQRAIDRAKAAEATIATLREEVERLRREAALSPPQASTTTHPQEPEGTATPGGHHAR